MVLPHTLGPGARLSPNFEKELKAIRKEAEDKGWRVVRGKKWKMYCPCPEKHLKNMSLTPSGADYVRNLVKELDRATCWKESSS